MDSSQSVKYALAGVSALALAGLCYYLSQDDFVHLDYKVYNAEKFETLMKEVQLEFTCIYARNYNLLLKIKENGEYQPEIMSQVRLMINKEMKDKTEQVVEDYGITLRQFEAWNEKFEDLPFLEKQREMMAKLDEDVFVNERISHLNFEDDLPEDLTAEKYLIMYKKIWAILRHDLYLAVKAKAKELRVPEGELPGPEFAKLYELGHKDFEKVRQETYAQVMDDEDIEQSKAREYMQKAYVMFSTISSTAKNANTEVTRARWPDLVHQVATEHGKLINEMEQGKFYDKIELDPRDNNTVDEKVDLKSLPQYTGYSTQKTSIADDKVTVRPVDSKADKYVDKMLDLARAAKKRVADRKAEPEAADKEEKKVAEVAEEKVEKVADPKVERREEAKAAIESSEVETVSHVLGSI